MLTIGEAARRVGVDTHVLRHWEDVGVLAPARTATGHRRYSDDDVDRARLVRRAQRTGLSLTEVRVLLTGDRAAREGIVAGQIAALHRQVDEARATIDFLEHTRQCRHRLVASCTVCAAYVEGLGGAD